MKKVYPGLNISCLDIDAIIVTHEHSDHIQSLGNLSKKYNLPVFATSETFANSPNQTQKISPENIKNIKTNEHFSINDLDILPFSIPHDAANPCGFCLFHDNKKISIATDIGHMSKDIIKKIDGSKFILIESNYDEEILKYTKYPKQLKNRIAGPLGHLSNNDAAKTLSYLKKDGLSTAVLGHLSKESNFPELAYQTAITELLQDSNNLDNFNLSVASRDNPCNIIHI